MRPCRNPACRRPHARRSPACSRRCSMALLRLRPVPEDASGGFVRDGREYVRLPPSHPMAVMTDGLGYVPLSRLRAAEQMGRPLARWERVLFRDGDRSNCDPANLVVLSASRTG